MAFEESKRTNAFVLSELYIYLAFFHVLIFGVLGIALGVHFQWIGVWTAAGGIVILLIVFVFAFGRLKTDLANRRVAAEAPDKKKEEIAPSMKTPSSPAPVERAGQNAFEALSAAPIEKTAPKRPKKKSGSRRPVRGIVVKKTRALPRTKR